MNRILMEIEKHWRVLWREWRQRPTRSHEFTKLRVRSMKHGQRQKGTMRATQGDIKNCTSKMESLYTQAPELCLMHLWETCGLNHHHLYPIRWGWTWSWTLLIFLFHFFLSLTFHFTSPFLYRAPLWTLFFSQSNG